MERGGKHQRCSIGDRAAHAELGDALAISGRAETLFSAIVVSKHLALDGPILGWTSRISHPRGRDHDHA